MARLSPGYAHLLLLADVVTGSMQSAPGVLLVSWNLDVILVNASQSAVGVVPVPCLLAGPPPFSWIRFIFVNCQQETEHAACHLACRPRPPTQLDNDPTLRPL